MAILKTIGLIILLLNILFTILIGIKVYTIYINERKSRK